RVGRAEMTKLRDALQGVHLLGFATAPIIYFIEANPVYDARVTKRFYLASTGVFDCVTSAIALPEVLVLPLRQSNEELTQQYRDLLLNSRNFHTLDVTSAVAERAANLRARYNLRTPDAL